MSWPQLLLMILSEELDFWVQRSPQDTQDHLPPSGVHDSSELGITTAASLEILVEWIGHGWSSFRI